MFSADDKVAVRIGKNVTINVDKFSIGDGVLIKDNVVIEGTEVHIGDYTVIGENTELVAKSPCRIGMSSWIGRDCVIDATGKLVIGNGVAVAAGCQLWTHMKFGDTLQGCRWEWQRELIIGDDVWIGCNSTVLRGVSIGTGAVIGANSVVTKSVPPYAIYAGIPAKLIKMRFEPDLCERLEQSRWWDLPRETIVQLIMEFGDSDINKVIKKIEDMHK